MFNFINTSRKIKGGENRKTEIQKKGVGGGGIFIYVFIYYNLQRWSKGVGVLGCPLCHACPCLAVLASRSHLHLLAATPSTSSWLPWLGLEGHSAASPRCSQQG